MIDAAAPAIRRRRISPGTDPSTGRICARRVQAPLLRRLNSGGGGFPFSCCSPLWQILTAEP